MKTWVVARKTLIELRREPLLLALVILAPLAFQTINAIGYATPFLVTYRILAISLDPRGEALIEAIRAQRYPDGRPAFDVARTADRDAAEQALREQSAAALIVISPPAPGQAALNVSLRGNAVSMNFIRASTLLNSLIKRHAARAAGRPEIVRIVEQPLADAGPQSFFDAYTPGMIVFGILLIIPQTAMLVAREVRWRTLHRLRISRLRAWELLGGVSLAQMVVAVIQVILILVCALALGFHNHGSVWIAILVGLVLSFSSIGLGLIVACFVNDDSQAINVGSTATMLQVWLSGAFFPMPPLTVFTIAGRQVGLFDVLAATHGMTALQQVLCYGAGLETIAFRLGAATLLSCLYFAAGVIIFRQRQMQVQ